MTTEEALRKGVVTFEIIDDLDNRLGFCQDKRVVLDKDDLDILLADDPSRKTNGYYMSDKERETHMHVMGTSGGGKSKLVEHMIRQDIQRGVGVCLIDPHAELYYDILRFIVEECPADIWDKVYLINPTADDYMISYNPFKCNNDDGSADYSAHADRLIECLGRIWNTDFSDKAGISKALNYVFQTAAILNLNVHEISKLLYDEKEREKLVNEFENNPLDDDEIMYYWRKTVERPKDFVNILDGAHSRLKYLINSLPIKMMTSQKNQINLKEVIDNNGIILVNLVAGKHFSTKSRKALGVVIVNEMLNIFISRGEEMGGAFGKPDWNPFYLYVDEFHNYYTPDFKEILTGGRKFRLHLIMINQYPSQLRELDQIAMDAILNGARIKAYFPVDDINDAIDIVKQFIIYKPQIKEIKRRHIQENDGFIVRQLNSKSNSSGETNGGGSVDSSGTNQTEISQYDYGFSNQGRHSNNSGHSDSSSWSKNTSESFSVNETLEPIFKYRIEEDNVYYTQEEVFFMEGRNFQFIPPRNFLFKSPSQKTPIMLSTEWVFNNNPGLEKYREFMEYIVNKNKDMYEKIPILKKRIKEQKSPKKKGENPIIKANSLETKKGNEENPFV